MGFKISVSGSPAYVVQELDKAVDARLKTLPGKKMVPDPAKLLDVARKQAKDLLSLEHPATSVLLDMKIDDGLNSNNDPFPSGPEFGVRIEIRGQGYGDTLPHNMTDAEQARLKKK